MRPFEEAAKYIGQKEKTANSGFQDPAFEKEMREEGWQAGWPWCQVFARLVYMNCYPEKAEEFKQLFSPSTVKTFRNFRDAAYPIGYAPQLDAMVIWQTYKNGKPTPTGHAGIVCKVISSWEFESIEGNTSGSGSREGWIVGKHQRKVFAEVDNGLKVMGFVTISPPIHLTLNV